ncbi:MAG: DegT/DnrJ/EryC1/StrS family aminotransferase [Opitutales bacterium]
MKVPYNNLLDQHTPILPQINTAIQSVLSSSQFIGNDGNPFVQKFESAFAAFARAQHCIGCSNGTDAIELVLRALDIGPGDEVIVPAQTWISTAEAVSHAGAQPVFADIDPKTYTLDPADLPKRLTSRTKAIIPVHLYGLPADMDPILAFAQQNSLKIIEDCAQAHGARYKDRPVGTMGEAGTFSFYPGKNLGAIGEAGGIVTQSDELKEILRCLRDHGRSTNFNHSREGRNGRLDGIQAAVLGIKLKYLPLWTEQRQSLGAYYREKLGEIDTIFQSTPSDRTHVYHVFSSQFENRDPLRAHLSENDIQTGVHYPIALPFLDAYSKFGYDQSDYPFAHAQMSKALSLPLFPDMTREQLDHVVECIARYPNK